MKAALLALAASMVLAQGADQPRVLNAKLEVRASSGDLASETKSAEPAWFGYRVESLARHDDVDSRCNLKEENQLSKSRPSTIKLEGSRDFALLFRVTASGVERIRLYSMDCALDAGGKRFVWLTGVPAEASIAYLKSLALEKDIADAAVFAIAQHASAAADNALDALSSSGQTEHLREQAIFWLGASRGAHGLQRLNTILASDPDEHVRDKAVFALSISHEPDALASVMQAAEHDPSAHVRGQALFWLGQKAGTKAAAAIQNAIVNDPDRGVKKQAVFAMSQLPKDQAVPKLIEIARTQHDPEVRKQAFFWLGQSHDPRAFAFFKEVLSK